MEDILHFLQNIDHSFILEQPILLVKLNCHPVLNGYAGDDAKFTVKLITPIAMSEKLNFAVREGGKTVGAG